MVLIDLVQFHEVAAPAPDPDDQIPVQLRIFLSIQQSVPVHRVDLQLVAAHIEEGLDQQSSFLNAVLIAEYCVMQL